MPTRRQIFDGTVETVSDVLLAADDRYAEAEDLIVAGRFDGAIYLLGYSAEMWMKAACLALQGLPPSAPVKSSLAPLKTWMQARAPSIAFTNYRSVVFLVEFAVAKRRDANRPLAASLLGELRQRVVDGVYEDWTVIMRYRRSNVTAAQAWVMLANVWWLRTNWTSLT